MARILLLTPQPPFPPIQGTTIRNYNLLRGLSQRHRLDLFTMLPPGAPAPAAGPLHDLCGSVVAMPAPTRSLSRRAADTLRTPLPDMALRLYRPEAQVRLTAMLDEGCYDILQVEGIEMAPYALAIPPARRPFLLFDDHNAEYVLQQRAFQTDARSPRRWHAALYSLLQWRKLLRYERAVCRAAAAVAAVSDLDAAALRRGVPGLTVTTVPNGVDLEHYREGVVPPHPGLGADALVFTGKMDYRPNVDAIVWFVGEVLPLIRRECPSAHLWVVGQQPHRRLLPLAQAPGVTLTGRVDDVRPYIAGAGVYVAPLRIGGGTRLKLLEAMAMGAPIVSTRMGADGFDVRDGEQLRLADDPPAFAAATVRLLRDGEARAQMGRVARAYVAAHYGWDAIVPRLEALYP